MKRCLALMLTMVLLCSCSGHREVVPTEEIIAAYAAAGYSVCAKNYDEKLEHGQIGYIQADHPNGDYIYFSIFETEEEAEAYKEECYHPAMLGLFSAIYGKPSWPRWEVHGCIVVQYDEPDFYEIFQNLLKSK